MSDIAIISYKKLGETPLECLERTRIERDIDPAIPMTYAGRLDPMAEGLSIILVGEECKYKEKYLGLDKTYEFEVLEGFETDTYDLLGIQATSKAELLRSSDLLAEDFDGRGQTIRNPAFDSAQLSQKLENIFSSFIGTFDQKYPPFSSKTVNGKQLFQLAKDDELPDELPQHEVMIYRLQCTSTMTLKKQDLEKEIFRRIALVKGDFRQEIILEKWKEALRNSEGQSFQIFSCVVECSSGMYVRQLVHDIGKKIGIPLVTYSIKRTKIGQYIL
jgi:tRNA pseudouridine55 synthase